jgi:hypothetical protein
LVLPPQQAVVAAGEVVPSQMRLMNCVNARQQQQQQAGERPWGLVSAVLQLAGA